MRRRGVLLAVVSQLLLLPILICGESLPVPKIPYAPLHYVCYRAAESLAIDGILDETSWQKAAPTALFVDIEGNLKPEPRFVTYAKMLWDSTYLYIGAELSEPDVWATITDRDAVIFHDNDFEVFIDPNGDTYGYYELELNALNTVWDLFLPKPYRDDGHADNSWDIQGLKSAVHVNGTLNTPGDVDSGWSVEIAIPWWPNTLIRRERVRDGEQWRMNFSRVEWRTEVKAGNYVKLLDSATGKPLPEDNWVWSPQGLIAMHYPEMWGIVQFSTTEVGSAEVPFVDDPTEPARWALRKLYYAEANYRARNGTYTTDLDLLKLDSLVPGYHWPPDIQGTPDQYRATLIPVEGTAVLYITQDGQFQKQKNPSLDQTIFGE